MSDEGRLDESVRLDGVVDKPVWATAPVTAALRTVEAREGEVPTGRTEVRVLAGLHALVFGVVCRDPDPAGIVSFTRQRDGDFDQEDHFAVVLDPFLFDPYAGPVVLAGRHDDPGRDLEGLRETVPGRLEAEARARDSVDSITRADAIPRR